MEHKTDQIFDKTGFEGFEGAFGSESFQVHQEKEDALSGMAGPSDTTATSSDGNDIPLNRNQQTSTTASPGLKYGYGVSSSILPNLSLSWFGGSGDKNPADKKAGGESSASNLTDTVPLSTTIHTCQDPVSLQLWA